MLTFLDIEKALKGRPKMSGTIPMTTISTLMQFTSVNLKIDEQTQDYYYSLDVDKLMNSIATKDCLQDLVDDGWSLTDDNKEIIKYLKNFK